MPLLDTIREAAAERTWSRGVDIARRHQVLPAGRDADAEVFSVATGAAVAATVHLWVSDEDWSCDCDLPADPCLHVVAAAIARSRPASASAPAPARVRHRLRRDGQVLRLDRVVVDAEGERPLTTSLASAGAGVVASEADLDVERAMAYRFGRAIPREAVDRVLGALAECDGTTLDGAPIGIDPTPVVPVGRIEDDGDGFRLRIVRDPAITEVVAPGIVRCGDALRPIGDGGLSREQRAVLGAGVHYDPDEVGALVSEVLPQLARHVPIDVRTRRLPTGAEGSLPRLVFHTGRDGDVLTVAVDLLYGDPPVARVERGELVLLGRTVPIRDLRAEQRLLRQLGEELGLGTGLVGRYQGERAVAVAEKLRAFDPRIGGQRVSEIAGGGATAFRRAAPLVAQVGVDGERLDVHFVSRDGEADPAAVLEAWTTGASMVPLLGGGYAPLPADWLAHHGHRLADLLASRNPDGTVGKVALFDLARLCRDLDSPPPPSLAALEALLGDFAGIETASLPDDLCADLRPYQRIGVNWLSFLQQAGLGGILADDMGLGKTLQALAVMRGRVLVVAPRSVLHNWATEAAKFRPGLQVDVHHGPGRRLDPDADLTITTYALLRLDLDDLLAVEWDAVVLDEAQAIKNPESQVTQAAFRLRARWRLTLTGTPVENRLEELWSQLHFLNPGLLGGRRDFDERYGKPIAWGEAGAAARLRERIAPFVLRRLKADVAPDLPPRTEVVLRCVLTTQERAVYDTVRAASRRAVVEQLDGQRSSVLAALEALLRLRQAACHPSLVPGQHASTADGSSSKLDLLLETLEEALAEGHKALVFSQWTSLLDLAQAQLDRAGIEHVRLDGSTRDRAGVVARFQDEAGPPVFLISLKAGGTGLNLTAADHVFLLDPWWNPAAEDQAADRAHRIGQERPVLVHRLVAEDTVEERILGLQERKRALAQAALGEADRAAGITREELLALLD